MEISREGESRALHKLCTSDARDWSRPGKDLGDGEGESLPGLQFMLDGSEEWRKSRGVHPDFCGVYIPQTRNLRKICRTDGWILFFF